MRKLFFSLGFFVSLLLVIAISLYSMANDLRSCAGVRILSDAEYARLTELEEADVSQYLLQNGHPSALDQHTDTLYVSVNPEQMTQPQKLSVSFSCTHPDYKLFFAPDKAFEYFERAISENHPFSLLVERGGQYKRFSVIFTPLPVLQLSTVSQADPDDRFAPRDGSLTLWDPFMAADGYYSIADSDAQWHIRGNTTAHYAKAPQKINLKKSGSGENRNLSLLGMGSDDDWILNSMTIDSLKLRERVIATLWNMLQDQQSSSLKMSCGEYVEVLMDGRYFGLYMLQRRIDNKSLPEDRAQDIILKGYNTPASSSLPDSYSIEYNPVLLAQDEIYALIEPYFEAGLHAGSQLPNHINLENWLDVNAFMAAFHLTDNRTYKNMFYLLHDQEGQYLLEFLLWDVDLALGIKFQEPTGFVFDPQDMLQGDPCLRREAEAFFQTDPALSKRLAARWQQLRSGILSTAQIESVIRSCQSDLDRSGALIREKARWQETSYEDQDTLDQLLHNLHAHLANMDAYFDQILSGN